MNPLFIHLVQYIIATIGLVQLLEGAIFMALISISFIYLIGVFENSPVKRTKA
jgi:NADH:ubiquinone oxidoreductase subunit 3 (subunit A)